MRMDRNDRNDGYLDMWSEDEAALASAGWLERDASYARYRRAKAAARRHWHSRSAVV